MQSIAFADFFRSASPNRDKFLSRLFGLFSEQAVRAWCSHADAPYRDLGRPTLYASAETRGHTLDFTLDHRGSGRRYVAELKCELEYEGYRYLTLQTVDQVRHHRSSAFSKFLAVAHDPDACLVKVGGHPIQVDGAILVWGATTPAGNAAVRDGYSFADVLSLEAMIGDLHRWSDPNWQSLVERHRSWSGELFDVLAGTPPAAERLGDNEGNFS